MKKIVAFIIVVLTTHCCSFGQGTIRGKITDKTGETLIGAVIMKKSNMSFGTITDLDGNYSLKISDSTAQTLIISYVTYKKMEETVHPMNGEVIIKDFVLSPDSNVISEVVVTAKATKANNYYMEKVKMNSATTIDYISSETMKKTGDVNVVAAVARVSGVSTNGGFITVRGIGDRYVKTTINGSRIPTLDPFTNNIKLDMFPASLVDNIIITKTASPDLPGDWAGAYLSVETKDYPDKLSVNVETSIGYNNQTTFKDVISSQRSSTDWLGYDNSFRDHSHAGFASANMSPTQYQQFVALGLGDYYKSMGVTGWIDGTASGDTYLKLGLVKLGLLAPAEINDPAAFANAKSQYQSGPYSSQAFVAINANVPKTGKSFADNWNTTTRKAPLSFSQSFTIGNQFNLPKERSLGFIAGFRYGSSTLYDPNSTSNRAGVVGGPNGGLVNVLTSSIKQEVSRETNGWSALMNVAYKFNPNNSVSLLFMPNLTGVNNVRNSSDDRDRSGFLITKSQFYEQRKQMVYQFKSEHYIPVAKLKVELNASYTNGKSSAPDFKNVSYVYDPITNSYQIGPTVGEGINRYYRYLTDNLFDSRLSAELPIGKPAKAGTRKLKFGGAYQRNDKKSDQYIYSVNSGPYAATPLINGDVDQYLGLSNFDIHTYVDPYGQQHSTVDSYYSQSTSAVNHTFGRSTITAGYVMVDYSILSPLRFTGGLRVEQANIFTDVVKFDSLGFAPNDSRRDYTIGLPASNPGKLNETSYLPSANIIYKVKADELAPINLRFNYSKTVARPSIRELSDVAVYDYEYRTFIFGNSDLKTVQINNYDIRLESYFKSGDNLSVSLFYKDFKNHIELVKAVGYSWQNVDKAQVAGIELEGKKKLTKHFELMANATFANSQTIVKSQLDISSGAKRYIPIEGVTRPMFGQAPYVINCIIGYTSDSLGLTVALSYNVQGPRLVIVADVKEVPDIYELQRNLLDLKISKKLGKHFSASFTVRDILNAPIRRAYVYKDGSKVDYDRYTYGTNYVLGIIYKL